MPSGSQTHLKYAEEVKDLEDIITPVQIYADAKMAAQGMNAEPEADSDESEEPFATIKTARNQSLFNKADEDFKVVKERSHTFAQPKHSFISDEGFKNVPQG